MQLIALLALALPGCEEDEDPPVPEACPLDGDFCGSSDEPPEIELIQIAYDGTFTPLHDGDVVPMFTPPQGGKIALIGARIHNMAGCGAILIGRLRDPTVEDEPVSVHEGRTVRFTEMDDRPGWGEVRPGPDARTVLAAGSNIPTCQNYEDRDMDDCDWIADVSVEDREGRQASARARIQLACPTDDPGRQDEDEQALCECECAAHYDQRDCNDLSVWQGTPAACEP